VTVKVLIAKLAVTFLAADMVTAHVLVPAQAPDQPEKVEPSDAEAVNVISVL
jgi:hypothetical protein